MVSYENFSLLTPLAVVIQQSNYIIMSVSLSAVKQVNPTEIIVSSKQDERLIKTLKMYGKLKLHSL